MAVESNSEDFNKWLNKKLESFEIEDEVMSSYISSIVTTDEQEDDKKDMLSDIFQDLVTGVNVDALCQEILEKWSLTCSNNVVDSPVQEQKLDLSSRVSLIVEKSVQLVQRNTNRSAEEEKLREAILSRCTYVSSEEEDYGGSDCEGASAPTSALPQNQNCEAVTKAEKEKRENMKQEAEKKKAQDKVNREKQKHKQEERREKERKRTQKQEKRR